MTRQSGEILSNLMVIQFTIEFLNLKKENVHLYRCLWGYNNYVDAYFQSSWLIDLAITRNSRFGVTCVRCGLIAQWYRVSDLHSVVLASISSGWYHGIPRWCVLIMLKQQSSVSVCRMQVLARFWCHVYSIPNTTASNRINLRKKNSKTTIKNTDNKKLKKINVIDTSSDKLKKLHTR